MKKERLFYDILSAICLLSICGFCIYFFIITFTSFFSSFSVLANLVIPLLVLTYSYSIAIIILAFKRAKKTSDKVMPIIGLILMPGILHLLYYFFNLRKQIPKN